MSPEAKQKLIESLRSGKYRQIRGEWDDGHGGYCVMGLVNHLGVREAFAQRAGALITMNDCLGLSFREIAARIEAGDFEISYEPRPYSQANHRIIMEQVRGIKDGHDDDDPPPLPAMIFIYPRVLPLAA